jgi:prepilin-type N-terminal cleavage/methylation domain-containing protein
MQKSKAFTLIELLIVVAIIAILAAIAVPNFLEAQTRSKVSRAKADMRTLTTAIESYYVDNNRYPYVVNYAPNPYSLPGGFYRDDENRARGLSTPIAYITSIPQDTFGGSRDPGDLYATFAPDDYFYATKGYYINQPWYNPGAWQISESGPEGTDAAWVLQSKGPDRAWARANPAGPGVLELDSPYLYQYDPTNGTISSGNIVRCGGQDAREAP